jgi:hypothetical protein
MSQSAGCRQPAEQDIPMACTGGGSGNKLKEALNKSSLSALQ